ncbi:uncharacterized protein LOC112660950 [Canis lupus dingo]|uniref:uncharacterized protein LOC112660950 n=1 Tax=Canis lupus dingo TaxID=286419 RepID=UPI0020C3245F|nr:uncharacterized protein LOC112660950 [Canis lupus dingo]XP_048955589.1 uncharacterized protein LOC112660950 [Canis lupus dingo]XP_048955590.1 uncharacterized protein LOC112660950 [Canis lupus dingo]XP_048955591.1 uncharacterized protein LOC112660950 [Canis lupus dingo]XP_048955592.1 uncharacterized protein LOC112660950 [Canis lupus dingo]XP_048955593.1 uncharacterized protein LOC112660950 [Canis lupus dingo]XP_048955594.1 uncharacterized protein LOC112660950 [Canis lupus dingo]XP_04895559
MVIPECPYSLLGRDLLTKMGVQIRFHPEGTKVLNKEGHLIQVPVLSLEDGYCLHQTPSVPVTDIDRWLWEFPQAWAETGGIGQARHRPAIYIVLKPGADPVRVRQYLMPLVSLTQTGTPHSVTKFWHRCTEAEISRTSHCGMQTPPGTRRAAVSSEKESDTRGQLSPWKRRPDPGAQTLPDTPNYTDADLHWIKHLPMTQCLRGWGRAADSSIILPEELGRRGLSRTHRSTHMGTRRMEDLIRHAKITIKDSGTKIEQIVASCHACQLTNASAHGSNLGTRLQEDRPGAYWEVDFTEVKPGKYGYRYLLNK